LTIWVLYLSAELTKTHSFRQFLGDFAHWVIGVSKASYSKALLYLKAE